MRSWSQTNANVNDGMLQQKNDVVLDFSVNTEPDNTLSLRSLWQRLHAARIQMVMVNNKTYLGLVPGRLTTSMLKIGDTLFIFAPSNNPILSVTDFLAQILRNVPDQSLGGLNNLSEKQLMDALGNPSNTMSPGGHFQGFEP